MDFDDWRRRRVAELYRERFGAVPSWYEDIPPELEDRAEVVMVLPPGVSFSGPVGPGEGPPPPA